MKTLFAYITVAENTLVEKTPLTIAGRGISFFIPSVERYSDFSCHTRDTSVWELTFFQRSPFSVRLRVTFSQTPCSENAKQHKHALARVGWWKEPIEATPETAQQQAISQFLRGSNALPSSAYAQLGKQCRIACDRNGIALVSTNEAQFQRLVICQALAAAYHHVMTTKMQALTGHLKYQRYDELITLHEEVLAFNAGDFFVHPVDICRQQLYKAWLHLAEHWQLMPTNAQLTAQLSDISNLLHTKWERDAQRLREARHQQERKAQRELETYRANKNEAQARRAFRINIILSIIGLLSVLSLLQITPDIAKEFVTGWRHFLLPR